MLTFKPTSKMFPDCTTRYAVVLDKEYTVSEFIAEVLTMKEWGRIGIDPISSGVSGIFGNPNCEYSGDKLITNLPDEWLDATIVSVKSSGGYTLMDYILTTLDEEK